MSSFLSEAKATRGALRRARDAAVRGKISPGEMQEISTQVLDKFAKALLEIKNSNLLKPKDIHPEISHVEVLNNYVASLLRNEQPLNLAGNPLDDSIVNSFYLVIPRLCLFKVEGTESMIALLSTGALAMAVFSYLHEVPLYVAAVDANRQNAILLNIPGRNAVVVDDIVGAQAKLVGENLRSGGKNVRVVNTLGR